MSRWPAGASVRRWFGRKADAGLAVGPVVRRTRVDQRDGLRLVAVLQPVETKPTGLCSKWVDRHLLRLGGACAVAGRISSMFWSGRMRVPKAVSITWPSTSTQPFFDPFVRFAARAQARCSDITFDRRTRPSSRARAMRAEGGVGWCGAAGAGFGGAVRFGAECAVTGFGLWWGSPRRNGRRSSLPPGRSARSSGRSPKRSWSFASGS